MSVDDRLKALVGDWRGTNKLNLSWLPDPVRESVSTSTVALRSMGQFLSIEYTWAYEQQPQEGILILGGDNKTNAINAFWTDSWHMSHQAMHCQGTMDEFGNVDIKGYYSVPDHPDWGWRTEIIPAADSFDYLMYNVSPAGDEEWAVETRFTRA